MWCKGYRGGDINNNIYGDTEFIEGLNKLQTDSGMNINNCISFITLKSIFSMDAYVLIPDTNGDAKIREMQQKMNAVTYKYCGVSPCDGLPQMKLTKQIIRYMQIIANDSNDMDGIFGNKTLENFLNLIESKKYEAITVLQLLLRINGYMADITGKIDNETLAQIRRFKVLMNLDDPMNDDPSHLRIRNRIDQKLICALIRSCGYLDRDTICCDTSFIITQEYANDLKNHDYSIVGRYISGMVGERSKALTIDEIEVLKRNKIDLFLIFQEGARGIDYFTTKDRAKNDGDLINQKMKELKIPNNNVIFVAVDFDIFEYDFIKYIVPYFEQLNKIVTDYRIGVYASRQGCKILKERNLAFGFFVAGASTGFSGNYQPIPPCWHFEQFRVDIKAGNLPIDKDAISLNYKECIVDFHQKEKNDYTELIMSKLEIAEKQKPLSIMHNNFPEVLMRFYSMVTHGGPWDLKVDESWKKTISSDKMPTFGFPGNTEYFFFQDQYVTREDLGNITYGYLGKAFGIGDELLYIGGGAAAHGDNFLEMAKNMIFNKKIYSPPYYGDSKEDHQNIEFGIKLYDKLHQKELNIQDFLIPIPIFKQIE